MEVPPKKMPQPLMYSKWVTYFKRVCLFVDFQRNHASQLFKLI